MTPKLFENTSEIRRELSPENMKVIRQLDPSPRQRDATKAQRKLLIKIFGAKCAYCTAEADVEAAHIRPLEIGANSEKENLILLCKECHRNFDSGAMSVDNMILLRREWSGGIKRSNRIPLNVKGVTPAQHITAPPIELKDFASDLSGYLQLRRYGRALNEINKRIPCYVGENLGYLLIKKGEITRRRIRAGSRWEALKIFSDVDTSQLSLDLFCLFCYENGYINRLVSEHSDADRWFRKSEDALKRANLIGSLRHIAVEDQKILCEVSQNSTITRSRFLSLKKKLKELKKCASEHGEFWGGRWALNCAVHLVQLCVKAKDADESWSALRDVDCEYSRWDVRTGWTSNVRPSMAEMNGIVRVSFPKTDNDLESGIGLLARALLTRISPKQLPEGVRDAGFGLAIGVNKFKSGISPKFVRKLSDVLAHTMDGTSILWPSAKRPSLPSELEKICRSSANYQIIF